MTFPGTPSTGSRTPTILVVDDEDIVRALVTRALREAGYRVVQAEHGAAALALLESGCEAIHLVISDLVMPGVGGREVARWVQVHCPALPVLFISGYPRTYLEAHDLYDAAIPLLRKPFLPSRLLEAVQELLPDAPNYDRPAAGNG
jgi:two-component system, cell cycle sensor histidine kinase and response regulator CckA